MRLALTIPILLAALAGCGKGTPLPPPTGSPVTEDDTTRIHGDWRAVGIRYEEGKPDEPTDGWTLRFDNSSYVMQLEDAESGAFTLLQTSMPKWIDFVTKDSDLRRGLYSLDGDKLVICFPEQKNADRPAAMKANLDDEGTFVITFTRNK